MTNSKPLGITDVVLRDGHQSLLATRMRIDDMLPIAEELDNIGYWSLETWGGATFDACIRYLGEDPWERLRRLKKAMPKTPQQMLLRGQNLLGYRHYADDVVVAFIERAAENGIDVFRIFDAMNDLRNLETAVNATLACKKHAQGVICYTVSPVHTIEGFIEQGRHLQEMGCNSVCVKDMAGLLHPYVAAELVSGLKDALDIPLALHSHATTGLSTATILKAVEAGLDIVDTSISSMSMTYGHSSTESVVSIFNETARSTGLDMQKLESVAAYFRVIRKKYAKFEGSLRGIDSRILVAQVPGGMLTNMESQLREQGAEDKFDEVLAEIPLVRRDLGYLPLVTPTSQIVGTQAVLNVLTGERYKSLSKETKGVLRGEYGATPTVVDETLQKRALEGDLPMTCRPADMLDPEMDTLQGELQALSEQEGFDTSDEIIEDVLIYAQFQQIGLKYLQNRGKPDAFEPEPSATDVAAAGTSPADTGKTVAYNIGVDGQQYHVTVSPGGEITSVHPATAQQAATVPSTAASGGENVTAPLAGNIFKIVVSEGTQVSQGDVVIVMEAMKMETEIRAQRDGVIASIFIKEGDAVHVGDALLEIAG